MFAMMWEMAATKFFVLNNRNKDNFNAFDEKKVSRLRTLTREKNQWRMNIWVHKNRSIKQKSLKLIISHKIV